MKKETLKQDPSLTEDLKDRELEILLLIEQGYTNREIADELFVSIHTIRWYNKQIYSKLGVHSRTRAVAKARELGLLEDRGDHQLIEQDPDVTKVSQSHHRSNFPVERTPFVGRDEELATIAKSLGESDTRLLTLIGPGGIGKTRLALEAGRRLMDSFDDGVYFVPLQALRTTDDLIPAIAGSLHINLPQGGDPRRRLFESLRSTSLLLIMDNFEHLLAGTAELSELLGAAPEIKILATSRERLNLREESLFHLDGMKTPLEGPEFDPESYGSVELFLQSARRIQLNFQPDTYDLTAIAEICTEVDGTPLAIELAAAWIEVLSPEEILQELRTSLDILQTDLQNVPERHRSMRGIFEGAWNLLNAEDQQVFVRMAVFNGGFSREAAEKVAGAMLPTLVTLVNKSLVHRQPDSGRFEIHELLRQYAAERLDEADPITPRNAHAEYFASLLETEQKDLQDRSNTQSLRMVEPDFGNITSAWHWAVDQGNFVWIDRMLEGIHAFFTRGARYRVALGFYDAAITGIDGLPRESYLLLLWRRGFVRGVVGMFEAAIQDLEETVAASREAGDNQSQRAALIDLGYTYRNADQLDKAMDRLEKAYDLSVDSGDKRSQAETLYHLGTVVWSEGDNRRASEYHKAASGITQSLNLADHLAMLTLHGYGETFWFAAKPKEAVKQCRESAQLAESEGDLSYVSENLQVIGYALCGWFGTADYKGAEEALRGSLVLCQKSHLWHVGPTMYGLGFVLACKGEYQPGLTLMREGEEETVRLDQPRYNSAGKDLLGEVYQELGLLEQAEAAHREGIEIAEESNNAFWLPRIQANLAIDRLRQGDLSVAGDLKYALEAANQRNQIFHAIRCLEGLIECALLREEPARALDDADRLQIIVTTGGLREKEAQVERLRSEALLMLGKLDEAEEAMSRAAEIAQIIDRPYLTWVMNHALTNLYRQKGQAETANQYERAALNAIEQIRDALSEDQLKKGLPTKILS